MNVKQPTAEQIAAGRHGGWAPGAYLGRCQMCDCWFEGAKRAIQCADCALRPPCAMCGVPVTDPRHWRGTGPTAEPVHVGCLAKLREEK